MVTLWMANPTALVCVRGAGDRPAGEVAATVEEASRESVL
jgi:hypothetical protein